MDIVARLLLREEIDSLEHELSQQRHAPQPDFARMQVLKQDIARHERRLANARGADQSRYAG